MSEGETVLTVASLVVAVLAWAGLVVALLRRSPLFRSRALCLLVLAAAGLSLLALVALLKFFASHDVRDDPKYMFMYTVLGVAWVGVLRFVLGASVGVRARDDVAERANPAAAAVQAGLILGLTLAYAGGNFGDGPGWWVVIASAALSSSALVGVWYLVESLGRLASLVTVERDAATGLRAASMLVACGAIFGRAVAGTWQGGDALLADFARLGWPASLIVAAEGVSQLVLRPSVESPRPSIALAGVAPSLMYLAIAAGSIYLMGWWA